jgi:biotin synthase-related radical SAM superfamily protein
MTPQTQAASQESPEYLRISLAAAMTLGITPGWFYRGACLRCINLLMTYDEGCVANCSYCGLQRHREGRYEGKSFIRVPWPVVSLDEIIARSRERLSKVKRVCLSMITHGRVVQDARAILERLSRQLPEVPISLLSNPSLLTRRDLELYRDIPIDRLGIAVDAATEPLFDRNRGQDVHGPHRWDRYWRFFDEALAVFGQNRVGVHLIVGIGETEEEIVRLIDRIRRAGGSTHLFSFFPEAGSRLAAHPQPPVGQYRRVQLARYLIDQDLARAETFEFGERGQLVSFGAARERAEQATATGIPFMTSGCPDDAGQVACNRPFGDCTPGDDIRSFPFQPDDEDLALINQQLWD